MKLLALLVVLASSINIANAQKTFNGQPVIYVTVDKKTKAILIEKEIFRGTKDSLIAKFGTCLLSQPSSSTEVNLGMLSKRDISKEEFKARLKITTFYQQTSGEWTAGTSFEGEVAAIEPTRF